MLTGLILNSGSLTLKWALNAAWFIVCSPSPFIHSFVLWQNKFILSFLSFLFADYFTSYFSKKFERTRKRLHRFPCLPTSESTHILCCFAHCHSPSRADPSPTRVHPSSKFFSSFLNHQYSPNCIIHTTGSSTHKSAIISSVATLLPSLPSVTWSDRLSISLQVLAIASRSYTAYSAVASPLQATQASLFFALKRTPTLWPL